MVILNFMFVFKFTIGIFMTLHCYPIKGPELGDDPRQADPRVARSDLGCIFLWCFDFGLTFDLRFCRALWMKFFGGRNKDLFEKRNSMYRIFVVLDWTHGQKVKNIYIISISLQACWKHEYVCNVQLSKMFSILAQVLADLWTLQLIKQ